MDHKNPQNPNQYKFFPDHGRHTFFTSLWFPRHGELKITYETNAERRAMGLLPAPTIQLAGEGFDPRDLVIKDQVGNLYELVPRRHTRFNN